MNTYQGPRGTYIPERMMPGITRYVQHGILPGAFLQAVIVGDLFEAVSLADDENLANLPAFTAYFYNEAPRSCYGSRDAMATWNRQRGREMAA